jgi:hypothetical protein
MTPELKINLKAKVVYGNYTAKLGPFLLKKYQNETCYFFVGE